MNSTGVYGIENIINKKVYSGQAIKFKNRKSTHFSNLRNNKHKNSHLQNAVNKYGIENFIFKTLIYCESFELTRYEQFFSDYYKNLGLSYNIRQCVDSNLGFRHSRETKKKLSKIVSGTTRSKETRKRMSIAQSKRTNWKKGKDHPMYGTTRSEEQKKEISVRMSGENNPMYRKHHTEKSKRKTSNTLMGHSVSNKTRKKMSNAKIGKTSNNINKKRKGSSSKYLGVSFDKSKNKWATNVSSTHIGTFALEIDAAKAYDKYVIEENLTNRKLNFVKL